MGDEDLTLYVGNLHENVTEELLFELFLQVGPLASVKIPTKDGKRKNFGFVEFKHPASIPFVLEAMRGVSLFKKELRMNHRGLQTAIPQRDNHNHSFPPMMNYPPPQLMLYGQSPGFNGYFPPLMMTSPMMFPPNAHHHNDESNVRRNVQENPRDDEKDEKDGRDRDSDRDRDRARHRDGDQERNRVRDQDRDRDRSSTRKHDDFCRRDDDDDDDTARRRDGEGKNSRSRERKSSPDRRRSRSRDSKRRGNGDSDQGYDSSPHGDRRQGGDVGHNGNHRGGDHFGNCPAFPLGSPTDVFFPIDGNAPFSFPRSNSDEDFRAQRERMLNRQNQMFQQRNMARNGFGVNFRDGFQGGNHRGNWNGGGSRYGSHPYRR